MIDLRIARKASPDTPRLAFRAATPLALIGHGLNRVRRFQDEDTARRGAPRRTAAGAADRVVMGDGPAVRNHRVERFTHVFPDAPASYFTFHALGQPGKLGAQWRAIKIATKFRSAGKCRDVPTTDLVWDYKLNL